MKILFVAATKYELSNLYYDRNINTLVTGIGQTLTTYHLTHKLMSENYDCVINIGIAGSFNKNINIGDVVQVTSEVLADLGSENKNKFIDIFDLKLLDKNKFPFCNKILFNNNLLNDCKQASGITVNSASGDEKTINKIRQQYKVDIESMEGASIFYICMNLKILFYQIRGISNYVLNRDTSKWNIKLAVQNLHYYISNIMQL